MVRVYLDQNKWIDLARAAHRRRDGERFEEALASVRASVADGFAQYPLSLGHYFETWRQRDEGARRRLAETMTEISRHVSIASPPALCNNELDAFLCRRFGHPQHPRHLPAFGEGHAHADGRRVARAGLEAEHARLVHRPPQFMQPGLPGRGQRDYGIAYADAERRLVDGLAESGSSGPSAEAQLAASAVIEIWENIEQAMAYAGLQPLALGPIALARPDLPKEAVNVVLPSLLGVAREFIAELPTRDAALRLRLMCHQNPSTRWAANDMNDIAYLACASVHCDVIVTERRWVHELTRTGLLKDHGTRALRSVADLPAILGELCAA